MSEIELLPCPMCNGQPVLVEAYGQYMVKCYYCGVQTDKMLANADRTGAIAAWNRRSPPQVGRGMEEALRKAAEQFRFYEREHMTKANSLCARGDVSASDLSISKAKTNRAFAEICEAALSPSLSVEGESRTAEDAARLILECTDIISEATAGKLAERIRSLGTGSREERSQADLGERRK